MLFRSEPEVVEVRSFPERPRSFVRSPRYGKAPRYGVINTGAFIKYDIGAFNIQLTEYNQKLRKIRGSITIKIH